MKPIVCIVLINTFLFSLSLKSQPSNSKKSEIWNCQISFENGIGPFETTMIVEFFNESNFTAQSPRNADKRVFGGMQATFARMLNKSPKKGQFVNIHDGKVIYGNDRDSIIGVLNLPMLGKTIFRGRVITDSIIGSVYDSSSKIGTLIAIKNSKVQPKNYIELYHNIVDSTYKYIYDQRLLSSKEWKRFNRKVHKLALKSVDDIEFFLGFNIQSQKLPFTHYNLLILNQNPEEISSFNNNNIEIDILNEHSVYMNIKSFSGSKNEMDSAFSIIMAGEYKNLIIDFRFNQGGGLASAIAFGKYFCHNPINAGYFVTNSWYSQNNTLRDSNAFLLLPVSNANSTEEFIVELKGSKGRKLIIKPGHDVFKGTTFILTSNQTASTCEPIIDAFKSNKLATVIGEKTAGAMLSATPILISDKYYVFLPIADYYTADFIRLDQLGVKPDITVDSQEALDYVLKNLIDQHND